MMRVCFFFLFLIGLYFVLEKVSAGTSRFDYARPEAIGCAYPVSVRFEDLPAPVLMSGIGNSHMTVTTNAPGQKWFDQGLNHLHSFWDVEAYRSFRRLIKIDSNCAMAYWGLYNSLSQTAAENAKEKKWALEKASLLKGNSSVKEQMLIGATEALAKDGRNGYITEMEAVIDAFPEDPEPQLLLANFLASGVSTYGPDGRPKSGKVYGQMLLKNVLSRFPNSSAAHHYWIHAVENGPHPELALASAKKIVTLAPASGHLMHMPGHIYYRLGDYNTAVDIFLKGVAADSVYMIRQNIGPVNHWNFTHNVDYMIAALAEAGRYREAKQWARKAGALTFNSERLQSGGLGYITYGAHTAEARVEMRFSNWQNAVTLLQKKRVEYESSPLAVKQYLDAVTLYCQTMNAFSKGDRSSAEVYKNRLAELFASMSAQKNQYASDWYFKYSLRIIDVNLKEVDALLTDDISEMKKKLSAAAQSEKEIGYWEPPHYTRTVYELLGQVLQQKGKWEDAIAAYAEALKMRPKSGHILRNMIVLLNEHGKKAEAKKYENQLQTSWAKADLEYRQN